MIADITFKHSHLLWIGLVIIPMIIYYVLLQRKNRAEFRYSNVATSEGAEANIKAKLIHLSFVFRMMAVALLVVVLARPQSTSSWQDVTAEGIDIIMAIDISGSMLAEDLKPNRLEASKKVAQTFIGNRPNDRLGLVVFAGESFTQCPLTTDHSVILNLFNDVKSGMLEDGTAIGMGLATSVKRLKDSEAISKVVILLTDGDNNSGSIAPGTAAEIAKKFGIRVYTIGVGTKGMAPMPYKSAFGRTQYQDVEVKINEELLTRIADMTGGKYFRATDNSSLEAVYAEIDELEKSKIDVTEYRKRKEEFMPFAILALLLLGLEVLLKQTVLRSIV